MLQNTTDFARSLDTATKLVALAMFLSVLAIGNRFIQDDAFISFRYAQHCAEGHGLTWNIGEQPVQGYTNFLWTLLLVARIH
jgi:arabinofuranosyltransferase